MSGVDARAMVEAIGDRAPTAAEAKALCDALGITGRIRAEVDEAPPLPESTRFLLRQFGRDLRARRAAVEDCRDGPA